MDMYLYLLMIKVIRDDFGEILFTDYGISGPPILQISPLASKALSKVKK